MGERVERVSSWDVQKGPGIGEFCHCNTFNVKNLFLFVFFFTVTGDDRGTSNGARPTMSYLAKIIFKA